MMPNWGAQPIPGLPNAYVQSSYAAMSGYGQPYQPFSQAHIPGPANMQFPGAGGLFGNLLGSGIRMFASNPYAPAGGFGPFNPYDTIASSYYAQQAQIAAGMRGRGLSTAPFTLDAAPMEQMARSALTVAAGGSENVLRSSLSKFGRREDGNEWISYYEEQMEKVDRRHRRSSRDVLMDARRAEQNRIADELDTYARRTGRMTDRMQIGEDAAGLARTFAEGIDSGRYASVLQMAAAVPGLSNLPGVREAVLGAYATRAMTRLPGFHFPFQESTAIGEPARELVRQLTEELTAGNAQGLTNLARTRGFSMSDVGNLMVQMSRRGVLYRGGQGAAISADGTELGDAVAGVEEAVRQGASFESADMARRIRAEVTDMIETMGELREIFGRGKTMDQLFDHLQAMTGGALGQLSQSQIRSMVDNVRTTATLVGVSAEQMSLLVSDGAMEAARRGINPIVGANATLFGVQRAQGMLDARQLTSGGYFGARTLEDIARQQSEAYLQAFESTGGTQIGAIGALIGVAARGAGIQTHLTDGTAVGVTDLIDRLAGDDAARQEQLAPIRGLMDRFVSNQLTDADLTYLQNNTQVATDLADALSLPRELVVSALESRTLEAQAFLNENMSGTMSLQMRERRAQVSRGLAGALQGDALADEVGQLGLSAADLMEALFAGEGNVTPEGMVQTLQDLFSSQDGMEVDAARALATKVRQSLAGAAIRGAVTGQAEPIESLLEDLGDRAIQIAAQDDERRRRAAEYDKAMRDAGIGQESFVGRIFRQMLEDEDLTAAQVAAEAAGLVDADKIGVIMSDLRGRGSYKAVQEAEMALSTHLTEREAERKKLAEGGVDTQALRDFDEETAERTAKLEEKMQAASMELTADLAKDDRIRDAIYALEQDISVRKTRADENVNANVDTIARDVKDIADALTGRSAESPGSETERTGRWRAVATEMVASSAGVFHIPPVLVRGVFKLLSESGVVVGDAHLDGKGEV